MEKNYHRISLIILLAYTVLPTLVLQAQPRKMKDFATYIWHDQDPYATLPIIPEKWSEESAVILFSDNDYYYFKAKKSLHTHLIVRRIVKLNDQAAVTSYSEFENLGPDKQLIVKIIKPDGTINHIDVDNEKVESSTDEGKWVTYGLIRKFEKNNKLAIPNLGIGDIIDYAIYYKKRKAIYGLLEAPAVQDFISSEYPIMDYELDIHSKKDFFISIKTENGAPDPIDISPEKGRERHYSFKMKDIEKLDLITWQYSLTTYPYVKFQVALEKDKQTKAFVGDEKSKIKDTVSAEEVLKYYRGITVFDHGYKGTDKFLKDKEFSKEQTAEEMYYYMRYYFLNRYMEAAVAYENQLTVDHPLDFYSDARYMPTELRFFNHYVSILREEEIPFELLTAIPRGHGNVGKLLFTDDITLLLKITIDPENPLYVTQFGNHTNFNYIPYYLEGNEVYSLQTADRHKLETINKTMTPVSDYTRNNSLQDYQISFIDGFEKIKVQRISKLKGHNKMNEIDDRLHFLDFTDEDVTKYNGKRLYDRLRRNRNRKKYEKEFPAFKEKITEEQKKVYQESLEEELNFKVDDFSFAILETGRYHIEDVLSYKEEFLVTNELLKRAGPNYLFEIGKLIGSQIAIEEKDKDRQVAIEMPYPRSFNNTITVTIPDGYTVSGLDKLNNDIQNETGGFVSTATVDSNQLTVTSYKYYTHNYEPTANWSKMLDFLEVAYQFSQQKILLKK